jgi:hypothetical protein
LKHAGEEFSSLVDNYIYRTSLLQEVLSTIFCVGQSPETLILFIPGVLFSTRQPRRKEVEEGEMEGKDTRGGRAGGSNQGGCNFNILQNHRSQTAVPTILGQFLYVFFFPQNKIT